MSYQGRKPPKVNNPEDNEPYLKMGKSKYPNLPVMDQLIERMKEYGKTEQNGMGYNGCRSSRP